MAISILASWPVASTSICLSPLPTSPTHIHPSCHGSWTTKDVGQSVKIRIGGRSRGPVQGCQEGDNEGGYVSPHVSWPTDEAYRCSSLAVGKRTDAALRMIRQGWDIDDEQYKKGAAVIGPDGHEHITYAPRPRFFKCGAADSSVWHAARWRAVAA